MVMMYISYFNKIVQLVLFQESDKCTMANKFLRIVVSWHGLLGCIISDHDPHFHGHFWEKFMSLLDTTLTFSMASHLQIDGIAEVTNHTME